MIPIKLIEVQAIKGVNNSGDDEMVNDQHRFISKANCATQSVVQVWSLKRKEKWVHFYYISVYVKMKFVNHF